MFFSLGEKNLLFMQNNFFYISKKHILISEILFYLFKLILNCRCRERLKSERGILNFTTANLTEVQKDFIMMQINNAGKPLNGRRFTDEQKTISLTLFKKSRKGYLFLSSLITLPSIKTLRRHERAVRLHTGINRNVNLVRNTVEKMEDEKEKVCEVMWDEFGVQPHVHYDSKEDKIIGFEDFGNRRTSKFANHVLVFMIRGFQSDWKMPVSHYFCHSGTTWQQLSVCIKENIKAIKETGLNLILCICDLGSSNIKALKELKAQYDNECLMKNVPKGLNFILE